MRGLTALCMVVTAAASAAGVVWQGADVASAENLSMPAGAFVGGFDVDGAGRPVVFNGEAVTRWDGTAWEELYRPSESVFGAFVKIRGSKLYFGESSVGSITVVDLETGIAAPAETIALPYDLAFDAFGRAFVSAPAPDATVEEPKNGFYLVDFDPVTAPDLVVAVPGYSGPLTFARNGDLQVATAVFGEPSSFLCFSPAVLQEGVGDGFVTETEGEVLLETGPAAYDMLLGPGGLVYASDSTSGSITAIARDGTTSVWASAVGGFVGSTYLAYDHAGGRVGVVNSDFDTVNQLTMLTLAFTWAGESVATARDVALPPDGFIGGLAFDGAGKPIVFDGEAVRRYTGETWEELYRPPTTVFGSFVKVRGSTLYFGESSTGSITAVDLEGGSYGIVETVAFNYDMAFDAGGRAFVSAPAPDSTTEEPKNGFYLVDLDPATPPDLVIELPGYSGPLTFAPDGTLYVATAAFGEPSDVLRFTPAAVEEGVGEGVVGSAEGSVFADGVPGAYSLTFGPFGLLMAGDSTSGQVVAIRPNGSIFQWAAPVSGPAFATFTAFDAPAGLLGVVNSDFATFNRLTLLETDYRYRRGTVNPDGVVDISDAVSILSYLFVGGPFPPNLDRLDVNDAGGVDVADAVYLLSYLFVRGPKPPEPFDAPGFDPTPDGLGE